MNLHPTRDDTIIANVRGLADTLASIDDPGERAAFVVDIKNWTTAADRWMTSRYTEAGHPCFRALHAMFDAIIAQQDLIWTKAGWFSPADLRAAECSWERPNGELLILFPIAYPWRIKPDENGNGGIRDTARFRAKEQRSFRRGEFGIKVNLSDTDEPTPPSIWE